MIEYYLCRIKDSDETGTLPPLWAIVPSDGTRAFEIEEEDIPQLYGIFKKWIETGEYEEDIDKEDYQLASWVTISEALAKAQTILRYANGPFPSPKTIRKALRFGHIAPAEKIGPEGNQYWHFSHANFNGWLREWQIEEQERRKQIKKNKEERLQEAIK